MSTREINKQRRRERILAVARRTLAEGGYRALNVRALAKDAGVTQPTLYNLIGNKDRIIHTLVVQMLDTLEQRLEALLCDVPADPLPQLEAVAVLTTELFGEDESFYRGAFVAAEFAEDQAMFWAPESGIVRRALAFPIHAFHSATTAGLMRGQVAHEVLIQQIFLGYRTALRDWAIRLITLEQYRVSTLRSFYCGMAADAVDSLRDELMARLVALPLR
ncbi:MAG: TetR/AcrR family transcriptional regulator [Myxococcota bacterium]